MIDAAACVYARCAAVPSCCPIEAPNGTEAKKSSAPPPHDEVTNQRERGALAAIDVSHAKTTVASLRLGASIETKRGL